MADRKTRSDCRVGTFEKKKGIPAGSIRHTNGRDVRSDMKIGTLRKQMSKGKFQERYVAIFTEEMGAIGCDWTLEQGENVYGDYTLDETLADRKSSIGSFFDIIEKS